MSYRKILLLGSGFVAEPFVKYVTRRPENKVTIGKFKQMTTQRVYLFSHEPIFTTSLASRTEANAQALAAKYPAATGVSCDINNEQAIEDLVAQHDIVIR